MCAFEYHNPQVFRVGCTLGQPFGEYKVAPGEYVPTVEQEEQGIKAARFAQFCSKSFLRRTPPEVRRRLLLEAGVLQERVPVGAAVAAPVAVAASVAQPAVAAVAAIPDGSGISDGQAAEIVGEEAVPSISESPAPTPVAEVPAVEAPAAEAPATPAPTSKPPIPARKDAAAPTMADLDTMFDKSVRRDYPKNP